MCYLLINLNYLLSKWLILTKLELAVVQCLLMCPQTLRQSDHRHLSLCVCDSRLCLPVIRSVSRTWPKPTRCATTGRWKTTCPPRASERGAARGKTLTLPRDPRKSLSTRTQLQSPGFCVWSAETHPHRGGLSVKPVYQGVLQVQLLVGNSRGQHRPSGEAAASWFRWFSVMWCGSKSH